MNLGVRERIFPPVTIVNRVQVGPALGQCGLGVDATIQRKLFKSYSMDLPLRMMIDSGSFRTNVTRLMKDVNAPSTGPQRRELPNGPEIIQIWGIQVVPIKIHLQNLPPHVV